MMRLRLYNLRLTCLLLLIFFGSCRKLQDLTTRFRLNYTSHVSVPSSLGVDLPLDLITPPVRTDAESQFKTHDSRSDLVREIYLETLDIFVESPQQRDLSFLKSLHIYIKAEGLPEMLLASADNIPENVGTSMSLTTSEADFKEYIKKENYTLRVKAVTDKLISQDVELAVKSSFSVVAGLVR